MGEQALLLEDGRIPLSDAFWAIQMKSEDVMSDGTFTLRVLSADPHATTLEYPSNSGAGVLTEARRLLRAHKDCRAIEIFAGQRRLFFMRPDGTLAK